MKSNYTLTENFELIKSIINEELKPVKLKDKYKKIHKFKYKKNVHILPSPTYLEHIFEAVKIYTKTKKNKHFNAITELVIHFQPLLYTDFTTHELTKDYTRDF